MSLYPDWITAYLTQTKKVSRTNGGRFATILWFRNIGIQLEKKEEFYGLWKKYQNTYRLKRKTNVEVRTGMNARDTVIDRIERNAFTSFDNVRL